MGRRFRQVLLSADQLGYGLTQRPDRPPPREEQVVPWYLVAILTVGPADLEGRGLVFQGSLDQLAPLRLAVLDLASGRRVALIRHQGAPEPGVEVHLLPQQYTTEPGWDARMRAAEREAEAVLRELLHVLGLGLEHVAWGRQRSS